MGLILEIFKNNAIDNYHLISLDIGTEIAKAAVFYIDPKQKKVIIIGAGEEFHKSGNVHGSVILDRDGIVLTCGKAINKAKKIAGLDLKNEKKMRVVVGISGELAEVAAEVFDYERKNQKIKIGQAELKNIIKKSRQKIFESVEHKMARKNSKRKNNAKFISTDIAEIKIDGYRVADILGFNGKKIEVAVYGTYMLADNFEIIKNISDSLNLNLINVVYNPCAVVKAVASENETESSAIFIDVGGSITDIALEKNGNVEDIKTFILGGRMFIEKTPSNNNSEIDKNESGKDEEDNGNKKNSNNEIKKTEAKEKSHFNRSLWLSGAELSLREFSENKLLPAKIFVYGGGSQLSEIADSLNDLLSVKDLSFAGKPEIKFIHPKDITAIIDQTGKLVNSRDVTLASIAASALN